MTLLRHSIEINCPIEAAFNLCLDVENWPKYFPPCKAAKILHHDGSKQQIEIVAEANDQLMTWQSRREIDRATHTIRFRQSQPSPLLKRMHGAWRFYSVKDGTLVSLEHEFSIKEKVPNVVDKVTNKYEAQSYMEKTIHDNTKRELMALKKILETPVVDELSISFQEELLIRKPANEIFEMLFNIRQWTKLLPHCENIREIYNDNKHQEFVMQVQAGGKLENIRTIRRRDSAGKISYFQAEPPPVLQQHHGFWELTPTEQGTLVTSFHTVKLEPSVVKEVWGDIDNGEALKRIKIAINKNSLMTMQAIAKA